MKIYHFLYSLFFLASCQESKIHESKKFYTNSMTFDNDSIILSDSTVLRCNYDTTSNLYLIGIDKVKNKHKAYTEFSGGIGGVTISNSRPIGYWFELDAQGHLKSTYFHKIINEETDSSFTELQIIKLEHY